MRVYDWSGSAWVQRGNDIEGEADDDRSGYSVSLSSDGSVVAIGAPFNNVSGVTITGHVRVYAWSGSAWVQRGNDIDGEVIGDFSGESVSLSGDGNIVAIGASWNDGTDNAAGHVRVYDWSGSAWVQLGNDIDGEAKHDFSGRSVSLSSNGQFVAIGAPDNDPVPEEYPAGHHRGHVRVYALIEAEWEQMGADIDGEVQWDNFGSSVSLSDDGNIVAIGAPAANDYRGNVRVHDWSGSAWVQRGNNIDGEALSRNYFGAAVSLSSDGNIVAIGAYLHKPGQVEVYTWSENSWVQLGSDLAGGGEFGRSVSLINNKENNVTTIAIGAHDYTRGFDDDAGRVTVFRFLKLSTCHPLISQYGSPVSSCEEYTDVPIGNNCSRRVFKREFRIKAKTEGLDAIYSSVFKLYKYIYQKANLSGKWVPAGRSEQYIHRSWWETDNNNIKMSNGSQWGTIQRAGTHRHVQVQVAGGAETNKGISDMLLVGENGNRYARTDNPPLAFHDQCNQTPEDHCDLPANRYSDSHHHCGGLPLGPIDNSSNDSFSAFFLPSGSYLTARATLGFAGCTRGSARWNNDDEALRELLIGEPAKHHDAPDHWQRNPGGLDGITWDFENVICINPTLPSPSLPTSSLAIRYSTEKPHIIALAAKRDLFGTPGFPATDPTGGGLPFAAMVNFYQLRPVDSNQNDNWMTIQPWFEWVLSDSKEAYPAALKTTMQCVKLLLSEDGSTCVAIYHRYYEGEYGWANSEGHWTNTNAIATVFKIENDNSGHAKSSVLYTFDMKRFRLSHATSWSTGAALSFDGKRLVVELHTTTEDIENLDQGSNRWKKSRMDATGAVNELCVIELTPTAPKLIATLDLRSSVLPSPEKGSAEDYLFRSLTANHDCSKFSIVKNIRPNLPSAATSAGLPLQKGVIETYSFDGSAIKLIGTFQELGMASHNEQYPWSHFTNDQHTPSPENVRARDFRGDISMSADGKYLHAYTRARTHNKATTDSTFFDYYNMSSYHWDAS